MGAKLGELGNWSEMKVLKNKGDSKCCWGVADSHAHGDAISISRGGALDGKDEELGVRGSELELQADRSCWGVQNTQGKGLHLHVALINIRVGDI